MQNESMNSQNESTFLQISYTIPASLLFYYFFAKGTLRGKDNHTNGSSARQVLTLKVLVELN
jgi:hypothetical protein